MADKPVVTKIDDSNIQVVKQDPQPEPVTQNFNYDFLLSQRIAIQKQKDDFDAQRDKELSEVNDLIASAEALGCKTKPTEVVDAPVNP